MTVSPDKITILPRDSEVEESMIHNMTKNLISDMIQSLFNEDKSLTDALKQSKNAQDFVVTGKYNSIDGSAYDFHWMVVADGHGIAPEGWGSVIDIFRIIPWATIVEKNTTAEEFNKDVNGYLEGINTNSNGSTLSIVKIFPEYIDCYWAGDSQIRIYEDTKSIFESLGHNARNPQEMERISKFTREVEITQTYDMKLLAPNIVTMEDAGGKYFKFDFWNTFNMTRNFGHQNLTEEFLEHKRINRNPKLNYKVIVASDGLWDMIESFDNFYLSSPHTTAVEICNKADTRWNQEWTFIPMEKTITDSIKTRFTKNTSQIDDIAVATWIQNWYEPINDPEAQRKADLWCGRLTIPAEFRDISQDDSDDEFLYN
jgi:serine/threonine protein phosphatase PrpC